MGHSSFQSWGYLQWKAKHAVRVLLVLHSLGEKRMDENSWEKSADKLSPQLDSSLLSTSAELGFGGKEWTRPVVLHSFKLSGESGYKVVDLHSLRLKTHENWRRKEQSGSQREGQQRSSNTRLQDCVCGTLNWVCAVLVASAGGQRGKGCDYGIGPPLY